MKAVCITIITLCILGISLITVPFIGFGSSLDYVVADAANAFGIEESEYSVEFIDNLTDRHNNKVYGLHTFERRDGEIFHIIKIRNTFSRPAMVATIFHEFAHAAQVKYRLDFGDLTIEQHAEVLSFSVMRDAGYIWDSLHLLPTHMFAKPTEYRAVNQLWSIAFTGSRAVSVTQQFELALTAAAANS
jgi:hypothetical protein